MVENRTEWRHIIRQTCKKVNEKRVNAYERQRDKRRRKENLKQWTIYYTLCLQFTVSVLICVVTAFGTRRIM